MHKVSLIAKTKPFDDDMTGEGLIAFCARVSNPSNQHNPDASKLLSYCIRNQHWSIFEMVNVVLEIETTRDIARQILRHKSFSFQEFSQRYAKVTEMHPPKEARKQDPTNRQNSLEGVEEGTDIAWASYQEKVMKLANEAYEWALELGLAKEVARVVLPEGLTMSRMYMNGSLRSWITYIDLRTGNGTQKEHRQVAESCKSILMSHYPFLKDYWGGRPESA